METLGPGTVIGQYSIINESEFQYLCKAKSNVSLLVLDRNDLLMHAERFEIIAEAIEVGTQYIIDNEVPLCDYSTGNH